LFGIGLPELVIIILVVLVLVNPKDLPALARRLGALVRKLRDLRDGFARTLREAEREITGDAAGNADTRPPRQKPRFERADNRSTTPPADPGSPYT
jgi:Sec-independent protein translocase protein TatA